MGLEEVKKVIVDGVKDEAKQLVSEAKREASLLLVKAKKSAKERDRRFTEALALDLESLERRELASIDFTARKKVMTRKKELIDEFFDRCMADVVALSPAKRREHIKTMVERVSQDFPVVTIYTNKKDLVSLPDITCLQADIAGGVILENSDGTQQVDLTYEALLQTIRMDSLAEIAGELFGE